MAYEEKPPIEEVLMHYGMPRRSGRYPWGSGKDPYQHSGDFLSRIKELKDKGLSEKEIADSMGLTTTQLRTQQSLAKDERRQIEVDRAKGLREKGYSLNEIAREMGYSNDSSVRSLLNENSEARMNQAKKTADFLRKQVDEKGMIDVGKGIERELNVSPEKMKQALYILELEGYKVYGGGVPQATNPGRQTNLKVLCPPGTEHKDIFNYDIHSVTDYVSHDGGETFDKFVYPASMDSKRLAIRYAEDGGLERDGLVEIRRGCKDLDLGGSHYAQVRILVDGTHYIKGMAVYSDDLPPGKDIIFNTNKTKDKPMEKVLKEIKPDPDNPFGSLIKAGGQSYYTDKDGNKQLSLINKRAEEGDWGEWSDKLASQFLSKQNLSLAKRQLGIAAADKQMEFEEICALTNPTVKKAMLKSFADDCDAAAVHLKAAALPGQKYQVIIPVPSLRDTEVFAPNYENGTKLALVRYPHGGTFEIPILTVNNKNKDAKNMIGTNALDAVGINSKVAERLSGADFDGDTVMVIPTGKGGVNIRSTPPLKGLEGFDPKMEYPERKGMKYMTNTQNEMGSVSNLITDMTLKGASQDELARAVRHSMVVIDAEKHKLDFKKSEQDNGIAALKKKYQGTTDPETGEYHQGASTLISRASSQQSVIRRQGSPKIDPETGEQTWKTTDNPTYEKKVVNKRTGKETTKTVTKMQRSTKMFEAKDAYDLVSDARTPMELAYADYANKMKALGNEARKTLVGTKDTPYSPAAKQAHQGAVASLGAKLKVAEMNAPKERKAQILASSIVKAKQQANPDLTKKEKKKIAQQALEKARNQVGAKRTMIEITDQEWEAIQAGAISPNQLKKIMNNANMETVKKLATPRTNSELPQAKVNRISSLSASGYTTAEIANKLGISTSTVQKYLK